jgi:hypothetical protein
MIGARDVGPTGPLPDAYGAAPHGIHPWAGRTAISGDQASL